MFGGTSSKMQSNSGRTDGGLAIGRLPALRDDPLSASSTTVFVLGSLL
jgi:hypothetical protein